MSNKYPTQLNSLFNTYNCKTREKRFFDFFLNNGNLFSEMFEVKIDFK